MRQVEILAPAGSKEAVKAAIYAGADAIYIGGNRFGARAFADNPDEEGLKEVLRFVHLYGKKIYLTTNTLVADREFSSLYEMVAPLYELGLDACIVQDLGVMKFLHRHFPEMDLHASTQMTLQSGKAANLFKPFGVTRFVPARELSIEEIRKCRSETDLEMEVFVHGALCYCYSGECLMSSVIGGRSGNRGMCAQPCRLPYKVEDTEGEKSFLLEKYLLSPKDVCTLTEIPELVEAGIDSFKIEGRMKKKEYAALTSFLYRKYVDFYKKEGKEAYDAQVKNPQSALNRDIEKAMDLFNRGGFCKGYLFEKEKGDIIYPKKNGHFGVAVGKVNRITKHQIEWTVRTEIFPQDVLEIRNGNQESLYEYTTKSGAKKDDKIISNILPGTAIKVGDVVYRRKNNYLLQKLQNLPEKKIHLTGKFRASVNEPVRFQISGKGTEITCLGEVASLAKNRPVLADDLKNRLMRTGDTIYKFDEIEVDLEGDIFIPLGKMNELRRRALSLWEETFLSRFAHHAVTLSLTETSQPTKSKCCIATIMSHEQLQEVLLWDWIELIHLPLVSFHKESLDEALSLIEKAGKRAMVSFPQVLPDKFSFAPKKNVAYYVNSWEMLCYIKEHHLSGNVYIAPNMYAVNEEGINSFQNDFGSKDFFVAFDESLPLKTNGIVTVYGNIPVMVTKGCVWRTLHQCQKNPKVLTIKNPKKDEFLVVRHCNYCYNTIYTKQPVFRNGNYDKIHFAFTVETKEQVRKVLSEWNN